MISAGQLAGAFYGIRLLLKLDPRALDFFEKTPRGFAWSFLPAAVLMPLHLTHVILLYHPKAGALGFAPYVVVQFLSYVMSWVAFPFVMIYIARLLGRDSRYFWHMVPYNWFQLVTGLVMLPLSILADLGAIPRDMAGFFALVAVTLFFTFASFIARAGLQIGMLTAIGIVILDLVLTLLTNQLISRI